MTGKIGNWIWKARSIIHAERLRTNPNLSDLATYGEGVIGARRVRLLGNGMAINNPEKCKDLETRTRSHMSRLDSLDLRPHHVDNRPQSVTTYGFKIDIFVVVCLVIYAWFRYI